MEEPERSAGSRALLGLVGLSGLAIAQPLLAVFGAAPDYFVFHDATAGQIVWFGVVLAFVPGLALWSLAALIEAAGGRMAGRLAVAAAVALLLTVLLVQLGRSSGFPTAVVVPLAVLVAVAGAVGWDRRRGVRAWAAWLAPAPVAFLALFLFASPVSGLVTERGVDAADLGAFGSGDPPPIVMVVFDEWPLASVVRRDGTVDRDLYPNVAALADQATWYRDTTTVANLTNFAVPALLTGQYPEPGDTADAAAHPQSLFSLLGGTYRLDVTERITRLCPRSLCDDVPSAVEREGVGTLDLLHQAGSVLADRLTGGDRVAPVTDAFVETEVDVPAGGATEHQDLRDLLDPRPESLDRFLRRIRADEAPTLHFLHVLAPHTPYRHLPDGHRYEEDPALRLITPADGSAGSDERADVGWPARLDRQRLQLEVSWVDGLIGDIVGRLRSAGLWDDALVVVTSDHGIAFEPGRTARGLGDGPVPRAAQPELLWVPLFVKAPGQQSGGPTDVRAQSIDVLPTMAELLGIDLPWDVDGRALGATSSPGEERRRFVRVQGSSFATFHLDAPSPLDAGLGDVLERGVDSVLPGRGPGRWFRVGPLPDLVGRPLARLPAAVPLPAVVDRIDAFADVDPRAPEVPALVSGRASGPDGRPVAIAVDGVVAAVVPLYDDGSGPGRFAAMVDPALLADGANRVTVWAVGAGSGSVPGQ